MNYRVAPPGHPHPRFPAPNPAPSPIPGPQSAPADPGPPLAFTNRGRESIFTAPGPKFAFTSRGPSPHLPTRRLYPPLSPWLPALPPALAQTLSPNLHSPALAPHLHLPAPTPHLYLPTLGLNLYLPALAPNLYLPALVQACIYQLGICISWSQPFVSPRSWCLALAHNLRLPALPPQIRFTGPGPKFGSNLPILAPNVSLPTLTEQN